MSEPKHQRSAPDPSTVEEAMIAACRHRGFDRSQVYASGAGSRGVRILAGACLKARFGCAATLLATLLKLAAPELSPSMLARYRIGTDDLLAVGELMGEGLPDPASSELHPDAPPVFQPRERKQARASGLKMAAPLSAAPVATRPARIVRLKPVSPDVARWGGFFLASPIWSADEVAELFDVHPDALVDAISTRCAA